MEGQEILELLEDSCLAESRQDFLSIFSESLNQRLGLSGSIFFRLNAMKDCLIPVSSTLLFQPGQVLAFSLKDTSNPVVYSLISNKPYIARKLNTLRNIEPDLQRLIKTVPSDSTMLCYPCKYGANKSEYSVFVFFAQGAIADKMDDHIYRRLLGLMSSIMGIYELAERKDKEKKIMQCDLTNLSRNNIQKSVREQIGREYIGKSKLISVVWDLLARAASASEVSVLLRGETGTGKDLAASLIHRYSKRSQGRFVVVNCAAIPEHLLESELFGYCKGAFTGANKDRQGLIKQADGGTLFLDEIGDLSEILQAKLLRVLQEKCFIPVGANNEEYSDFRLITATHRPLEEWIENDKFRRDLFYRINQFNITIPVLTDREEDIPILVDYFTNAYMQENATHISGYEDSAKELLQNYHYPGNIRELKNIVFQACMFVGVGNMVTRDNIQARLHKLTKAHLQTEKIYDHVTKQVSGKSLPEATEYFEKKIIRMALQSADGSRSIAASSLGIPKRTLAHKCKKWRICCGD